MAAYRDQARPIVDAGPARAQRPLHRPRRRLAQARTWWACADYAGAKALRQRAGITRMIVVEGVG